MRHEKRNAKNPQRRGLPPRDRRQARDVRQDGGNTRCRLRREAQEARSQAQVEPEGDAPRDARVPHVRAHCGQLRDRRKQHVPRDQVGGGRPGEERRLLVAQEKGPAERRHGLRGNPRGRDGNAYRAAPKKTAQALFGQEEAAHSENAGRGEEIRRADSLPGFRLRENPRLPALQGVSHALSDWRQAAARACSRYENATKSAML